MIDGKTYFVFIADIDLNQLYMVENMITSDNNSYMNILHLYERPPSLIVQSRLRALRKCFYNRLIFDEVKVTRPKTISLRFLLGIHTLDNLEKTKIYTTAIQEFLIDYPILTEKIKYYVIGNPQIAQRISYCLMKLGMQDIEMPSVIENNWDDY